MLNTWPGHLLLHLPPLTMEAAPLEAHSHNVLVSWSNRLYVYLRLPSTTRCLSLRQWTIGSIHHYPPYALRKFHVNQHHIQNIFVAGCFG